MEESSKAMQDKTITASHSEEGLQSSVTKENVGDGLAKKDYNNSEVSKDAPKLKEDIEKSKLIGSSETKTVKSKTKANGSESNERARSRSKSPRGKTPKVQSVNSKTEKVSPLKKESATKKAQKRKAKDESNIEDKVKEPQGPKPKQPKNAKKKGGDAVPNIPPDATDSETSAPKPKRKYVRKNKNQEQASCSIENKDVESGSASKKENIKSLKKKKNAPVVENGEMSEREAQCLAEKVKKKPGPKKGSKRKPKVEADSTTLPQMSDSNRPERKVEIKTTSHNVETEADSDTVEYNVTSANSQPVEIQTSNKKVVKIDDIEITELSDLNSSREESAEENEADHSGEKGKVPAPMFISLEECEQADKTFLCSYPDCKYQGKSRVTFRKHLSHHQIYLCAHCEYHCNVFMELETHMVANHPQRWGRKKCKKCQRYIKGDNFDGHEEKCDGTMQYPCEKCDKVFKYESKLLDHERKFHASLKCEHCEYIAESKISLNKHVSTTHPKPKKPKTKKAAKMTKPETESKAESTEPSESCQEITRNNLPQEFTEENIPEGSPVGTVMISPLDDTPEKVVAQPVTVLPVDTTVKDEILPGVTPISVPLVEKDNMQITSDSSGQVTLSIPEPSTNTLMSPDSTTPMLLPPDTKSSDTVQVCDVEGCGQVLKTYRLLMNHKKNVHNILPSQQMHPCEHPDCNLVFKKKGQLKKHQVVHTGERKYICTYEGCGKAFRHNANLKIHNLLHTGEKPIKCRFCEFACRQKSSLIHHMKTKHKEIGWPIKGEAQYDMIKTHDSIEDKSGEKADLKTEVESGSEQASDADQSFVSNSSEHKLKSENTSPIKHEQKIDSDATHEQFKPEISSSKTSGVKSEDKSPQKYDSKFGISSLNHQSKMESASSIHPPNLNAPITLSTPTKAMVKAMAPGFLYAAGAGSKPLSPAVSLPASSMKTDVYDFDEDDDVVPNITETPKPSTKKSPAKSKAEAKSSETTEEGISPVKKKRGPRKKKDDSTAVTKPESPKVKKTSPKKKKASSEPVKEETPKAEEVTLPASVNEVKPAAELEAKPEIEPDGDSLVEEHVSENAPALSTTSSESAPVYDEPEHAAFDDNMGPPHAPAPAYTHHDHSPLSALEDDIPHPENPKPVSTANPDAVMDEDANANLERAHKSPFSEISPVSQEQVLSNDTSRALSSVASLQSPLKEPSSLDQNTPLDMHVPIHRDPNTSFDMTPDALSPHKKVNSSFELPNDIDPDEAAKILEESDERERKNMRNEKGHMREVGGEFVPVLHEVKDGYKYISSPPRSMTTKGFPEDLHLAHGTERSNVGETSPYDFPNYRQHHSEFSHIQGIESQAKDPAPPGVYTEPSQRRPSSSYVPDFLPSLGTTSAGPPSVSSNYSTHSNPVSQNQTDLATYGASSAAGLPSYPPPSSSVPSYLPPPSVTSYPSTTPVTSTSYTDAHSERATSVGNSRPADPYRLTDSSTAPTTTTSSTLHPTSYPSRDLFPHYFSQDPSLPLPPVGTQQDPRSLAYPPQQSSLQALQRSSADFLQRASAGGLPGMNYPSVTESLARLSQTTSQQPWIGHDERSRPWAQASPILMPPEIDTASSLNRNPFSAPRPELSSLDAAAKRPESGFPGVPQTVSSAPDRYDVASAYMGSGHFNPAAAAATSNYSKSLTSNPQKQLEEAYRQSAAVMNDYRSLSHAPPSVTDMYSRMGMNPALGLDKYYPYSREAMYRTQQLGSNPFMPPTSTSAQMPYSDRDYPRNPYAQETAYGKYLPGSNLTQSLPPALQGAGDYFQPRPGAPDPYMHDPYRRSVIHNMMSRFYN